MNTRVFTWLAFLPTVLARAAEPSALTMWYAEPARLWTDSLPLGNGRMGAMVFGGVARERIQFNEQTVWTGEPHSYAHAGASKFLTPLRELLFAGKQAEAEALATQEFLGVPVRQKSYQALTKNTLRCSMRRLLASRVRGGWDEQMRQEEITNSNKPKSKLGLPDLDHSKAAVLDHTWLSACKRQLYSVALLRTATVLQQDRCYALSNLSGEPRLGRWYDQRTTCCCAPASIGGFRCRLAQP